MDRLSSMKIFQRVVEMGSFSAVAKEMGLSQSSISKSITALEKYLVVRLLIRNTRSQILTEAGKEYYDYCVRILNDVEEAESVISENSGEPKGQLRLSAPFSYGQHRIEPLLWGFMKQYPELNIDFILSDQNLDMIKEGIDLSIRLGPLSNSSLIARQLGTCPRYTVASPEYLKIRGQPQELNDLVNHQCIVFTLFPTKNIWHFSHNAKAQTIHVTGNFSTNSPDTMREATIAGKGIAVMPHFLIEKQLASGQLVKLLHDYIPIPVPIHVVYPMRRFLSPKIKCFIDYFQQQSKPFFDNDNSS
jgi:DNA-binding transcriptional LysR family regulator